MTSNHTCHPFWPEGHPSHVCTCEAPGPSSAVAPAPSWMPPRGEERVQAYPVPRKVWLDGYSPDLE